MLVTVREQEIPDGDAESANVTVPEKPDPGVTVMVEVPAAPVVNVTVDGEAKTVKADTNTAIERL